MTVPAPAAARAVGAGGERAVRGRTTRTKSPAPLPPVACDGDVRSIHSVGAHDLGRELILAADDGEVLWAHFSGLAMDGYRTLQEGQRVSFVWNGGIQDHGRHRAEDVRLPHRGGAE